MKLSMSLALAAVLMASAASAAGPDAKPETTKAGVEPVRSCLSQNLVARGALRDLSLDMFDGEGKVRSLRMKLFWKPAKAGKANRFNLRLTEPLAMAGSSYLLVQSGMSEEVYFNLPGAEKALRITGQNMNDPLWGSDFSYAEIKQVLGLVALGNAIRLTDSKLGDRPTFVLETQGAGADGYRRVVSHIDQASCVLARSEFYGKAEQPKKTLDADMSTLLQADKYWTVLSYTMSDLQKKTRTQLGLSDIAFDERLDEKLFDPKTFFKPAM